MYASPFFGQRQDIARGMSAYHRNAMEIEVASADAHRLVTLLFEGFETALADAQGAYACGDAERKGLAITRAVRIVDEGLRAALNLQGGGALARDLNELYAYIVKRLSMGHLHNKLDTLDECRRLMRPVHEAWLAISSERKR